jgi:hypothetical protein
LNGGGEFDFGLFGLFSETLKSESIFAEINSLFFLEFGNEVVENSLVKIFSSEESISVGCLDFKDSLGNF